MPELDPKAGNNYSDFGLENETIQGVHRALDRSHEYIGHRLNRIEEADIEYSIDWQSLREAFEGENSKEGWKGSERFVGQEPEQEDTIYLGFNVDSGAPELVAERGDEEYAVDLIAVYPQTDQEVPVNRRSIDPRILTRAGEELSSVEGVSEIKRDYSLPEDSAANYGVDAALDHNSKQL